MEYCKSFIGLLLLVSVSAQVIDHHHQSTNLQVKAVQGIHNGVVQKSQIQNRITGGTTASANEYPWMVYLEMFKTSTSTDPYVCGGTLINNQWVLTAAVCLDGMAKIDVFLGAHNIGASSEQYRVKYTSTTFMKHPNWTPGISSTTNNIGLIKLPNAITFTNQIKSIGLPLSSDPNHVGDTVYLSGWGSQSGSDQYLSSYLRKVTTVVMSNAECQSVYGNAVTDFDICSRGTNLVGICPGDNGGPMMYRQSNGTYIQLGVASFWFSQGSGCSSGYPSGFVRVSKYVDWIKSTSSAPITLINSILLTSVTAVTIALRNTLF